MRIDAVVTSLSWIPQDAMSGLMKVPMDLGISHYDRPPPEHIDEIGALRDDDRFRFANVLSAWIEVEDGEIADAGYTGGGQIGSTTLALGPGHVTIPAVPFPDRRAEPVIEGGTARFVQTAGGRTGAPMPRKIDEPPYFTITAPVAWTTLALEINVDGSVGHEVVDASAFPRHWIYDEKDDLVEESGLIDFKAWSHEHFGDNTPWGHVHQPVIVTEVETSLERHLSERILREGHRAAVRELSEGDVLVSQGEESTEVYLLMDGVLMVEIDGEEVVTLGPGTIVGERASLEGGFRTATLRAVSPVRLTIIRPEQIDQSALTEIARVHGGEGSA